MSRPWPCTGSQASCLLSDQWFINLSVPVPPPPTTNVKFRERVKISKGAVPSALLSNAASKLPWPSLPALFPRSNFHLRLPLYKCQAGFSHCSPTKSPVKGGFGPYLLLLGRVPMRATDNSLHVLHVGMELSCCGLTSCTGAKTEPTCFVQRTHLMNTCWIHAINNDAPFILPLALIMFGGRWWLKESAFYQAPFSANFLLVESTPGIIVAEECPFGTAWPPPSATAPPQSRRDPSIALQGLESVALHVWVCISTYTWSVTIGQNLLTYEINISPFFWNNIFAFHRRFLEDPVLSLPEVASHKAIWQ